MFLTWSACLHRKRLVVIDIYIYQLGGVCGNFCLYTTNCRRKLDGLGLHSGARYLGVPDGCNFWEHWNFGGILLCCSIVVDGCIKFLFRSIFLQSSGAGDAGAEGGVPSALQHISAAAAGQVKLPLYTGSALSRLALVLMVHLDALFLYL